MGSTVRVHRWIWGPIDLDRGPDRPAVIGTAGVPVYHFAGGKRDYAAISHGQCAQASMPDGESIGEAVRLAIVMFLAGNRLLSGHATIQEEGREGRLLNRVFRNIQETGHD